jgi:hypothetical protein
VNDANLFEQWLLDANGGGLKPGNVKKIVSPANGTFRPIRDEIEDEIISLYAERNNQTKPLGRRLYLYFSGHGIAPGDGDECALVMANSYASPWRAFPGRMAANRVLNYPMFKEVVLIMDCCREVPGAALPELNLPAGSERLADANFLHAFASKWEARAAEKELPSPFDDGSPPNWHGVFTHTLIKGLRTATDETGLITAKSLKDYVRRAVQDLLPAEDNRRPEFLPEECPIVFGRGTLTSVTVRLRPGFNSFQVLDGSNLALIQPPTTKINASTYSVKLRPGSYVFRAIDQQGGSPAPTPVQVLTEAQDVFL